MFAMADFEVKFKSDPTPFGVGFGEVNEVSSGGIYDEYAGEYEVTPRITEQVLPTSKKVMTDDLVVREIPVTRVTNTSGGNTIIIG